MVILLAKPQKAEPHDPSNMILSGYDSVGLPRDKDCSQLANKSDYCSIDEGCAGPCLSTLSIVLGWTATWSETKPERGLARRPSSYLCSSVFICGFPLHRWT